MTGDHPGWCDPSACTIAAPPALYCVLRRHASTSHTIGTGDETVNICLIQEAGQQPRVRVTTPWSTRGGAVEFDTQNAQQLRAKVGALLELAACVQERSDA